MVMVEAVGRLIPGVLGNSVSAADDSFSISDDGALVEGPVYTKPQEWRALTVPEVLMSGHHSNIADWRSAQAHERTHRMRPDL